MSRLLNALERMVAFVGIALLLALPVIAVWLPGLVFEF